MNRKLNMDGARSRLALLVASTVVMLALWMFSVILINERLAGGIGLTIALIAGSLLPLGILLLYHNLVDWLNLGLIRRTVNASATELVDGEVIAFTGSVEIDEEPLISPITNKRCAAYTYKYSASRRDGAARARGGVQSRIVLGQGFHMLRTRIQGAARAVNLGALPGFESEPHEASISDKWAKQVEAHLATLPEPTGNESPASSMLALTAARTNVDFKVAQDFYLSKYRPGSDQFSVEEETLAVDENVCVIGTYDQEINALTPSRNRLGPNLMVYHGSAEDVLSRVGKDVQLYFRIAAWMIGIGVAALLFVLLPKSLTGQIPILGSLLVG